MWIFIKFLESALNFENFEKEMSLMPQVFLKLLTPENVFTYMHKRSCLWKIYGSERVNESLKLLKSAEKYFYATFLAGLVNLR